MYLGNINSDPITDDDSDNGLDDTTIIIIAVVIVVCGGGAGGASVGIGMYKRRQKCWCLFI